MDIKLTYTVTLTVGVTGDIEKGSQTLLDTYKSGLQRMGFIVSGQRIDYPPPLPVGGLVPYNDLAKGNEGDPCFEYPGTYIVFLNGIPVHTYRQDNENVFSVNAIAYVRDIAKNLRLREGEEVPIFITWTSDPNDPRNTKEWFESYRREVVL